MKVLKFAIGIRGPYQKNIFERMWEPWYGFLFKRRYLLSIFSFFNFENFQFRKLLNINVFNRSIYRFYKNKKKKEFFHSANTYNSSPFKSRSASNTLIPYRIPHVQQTSTGERTLWYFFGSSHGITMTFH